MSPLALGLPTVCYHSDRPPGGSYAAQQLIDRLPFRVIRDRPHSAPGPPDVRSYSKRRGGKSYARFGIKLSEHLDGDGRAVFEQACKLGLEGIVSKRLSAPYLSAPSRDWLKVKNPDSLMRRVRAGMW